MFVFHLPSGASADIDGIIDAMLEIDDYPQYYLDTEVGAIVRIATLEMLMQWIEEIGSIDRYLLIPRIDDDERSMLASAFIDEVMTSDVAPRSLRGARVALAEGEWELFEIYLSDETDGLEMIWEQFLEDHAWERAHRWLIDEQIGARSEFEGCGHCALCEALTSGEEDPDTLLDAFMTEEVMERVGQQMEEIKRRSVVACEPAKRTSPQKRTKKKVVPVTSVSKSKKSSASKRSTQQKRKK